jgi:hypothetical protein
MRGISHSGCSMGWAKIEGLITATSATTCTPAFGSVTGTLAVANNLNRGGRHPAGSSLTF